MDCKMVYAIVPRNGKTLEELAERREARDRGLGDREQGDGGAGGRFSLQKRDTI
jgi:hypothetical protein